MLDESETPESELDESESLESESDEDRPHLFPVVGVGASAGGLDAFTRLLQHLPADTGMAFVFVQHLAPQHASLLASILSRSTSMTVMEAQQSTRIEPNHIYVIPPNKRMRIANSTLELAARSDDRGAPRPIDYFFRSLAEDRRSFGIGVLLSGADSDGAQGLQAIREEGGIAIVQSENSANSPQMPHTAIAAGIADLILAPEEIGAELGRIGRHPAVATGELRAISEAGKQGSDGVASNLHSSDPIVPLTRLLELLRSAVGIDFSGYRQGTLRRRIARRMLLQRYENFGDWLAALETNRADLVALSEDLLIHVTSFFRDADTFEIFERSILPKLLDAYLARNGRNNTPFRIWCPGCSTGQEVYSIAMCLVEAMGTRGTSFAVQIFGTDLSERVISVARDGLYPESEVAGLSPDRQARFFVRTDSGFRIVKQVRDMCVFARQNLLADPPFSHLNLISCRNLLIYLGRGLQRQLVAAFHYALQAEGCLWLGHSESLRDFPEFFEQIEKAQRFYLRKPAGSHLSLQLLSHRFRSDGIAAGLPFLKPAEKAPEGTAERTAERIVLSEFGPAWVLVTGSFEILNSRGDVSPYLQLAPGRATLNLLRMARDEIRGELTRLLTRAKSGEFHIWSSVLHHERDGLIQETRLEVRRIVAGEAEEAAFLVVFFPAARQAAGSVAETAPRDTGPDTAENLRQELLLANQRLQAIIGERDASNQELTSANEEIQSSNEELQSVNEELETSKEELQSSNEELNTLNEELQHRNQELVQLSDDLANLLSSTTIPILMLDNGLRIRRVTPAAERLFGIRQTDVGRPIGDLRLRIHEEDLDALLRRVINTLAGEEVELLDREGHSYLLRARVYRTADNRIEGAVLAIIDVEQMRRAQERADVAREFAESLIESVQTPLLVLTRDLRVRMVNPIFLRVYGLSWPEIENQPLDTLRKNQWNAPDLSAALRRLSRGETVSEDLEFDQEISPSSHRSIAINARRISQESVLQARGTAETFLILVAATDVTAQRRADRIMVEEQARLKRSVRETESALHESEDALRRNREELRALSGSLLNAQDEERRRLSRELHDDLSQTVAKLQFDIETLEQKLPEGLEKEKKYLLQTSKNAGELSNDLRRMAYALHPSMLDHLGLAVALRSYAREFGGRNSIQVKFSAVRVPPQILPETASSFYRIVQEALRNIARHAAGSTAAIRLVGTSGSLRLTIRDDGPGFDRESVRGKGGLGLISMEERARLIHATFQLSTEPGKGTMITVAVPLNEPLQGPS